MANPIASLLEGMKAEGGGGLGGGIRGLCINQRFLFGALKIVEVPIASVL